MKITAEELRKVYEETFEGAIVAQESQAAAFDAALLAVARYVAEKQRGMEPTQEMIAAMPAPAGFPLWPGICADVYRAMQSAAPLVVE